jgi:hypothetical protein
MFLAELRQPGEFPALSALRQQVYGQLEGALAALDREDLLSGADLRDIALTSWATVHGLASLLVDGQVHIDVAAKDMAALVDRVLAVQAEGFLAEGVRLGLQAGKKPAAAKVSATRRKPR